jgi:hypothetical protein
MDARLKSFGDLFDELSICNIKIWHAEDRKRDESLPDDVRLAAATVTADENQRRNRLIDAINATLAEAVAAGKYEYEPKRKVYGGGG